MELQQNIEAPTAYARLSVERSSEQADRQGARSELPLPEQGEREKSGQAQKLDAESMQRMLDEAQSKLETHGVHLRFKLNKDAGGVQVEVRDPKTDKIIRKIPDDELVRLTSHIKDFTGDIAGTLAGTLAGALMDKPI